MPAGILEDFRPRTVERFGGLVSQVDRFDLVPGQSPQAVDIEFYPGGFRSRPGLTSVFTGPASVTINGLKEWVGRDGAAELLGIFSSGIFFRENVGSYFQLDDTLDGGKYELSMYMRSCTAFGREYIGFSNGKKGVSPPREYIGGTSVRLSQAGPGDTCAVADTVNVGTIDAGARRVIVVYLLREGGLTSARGYASFTAAGSLTAQATGLPIGPAANVVGRRLYMTLANSTGPYYSFVDTMTIWDNTTTTWEFDVSDEELVAGENSDELGLLRRVTIGPAAGFEFYAQRIFGWGVLNEMAQRFDFGLSNTHFDGGFYDDAGADVPLGWKTVVTGGTGGQSASGMGGASGDVYVITSDGASASQGAIYESQTDLRTIMRANTSYGLRLRAKLTGAGTTGAVRVRLCTMDGADDITTTHATYLFPIASLIAGRWTTLEGAISTGSGWPVTAVTPVNWVIDLAPDGSAGIMPNTEKVEIDYLVPYDDSTKPVEHSVVRVSRIQEPGAFDAVNGLMRISPEDGYDVRNLFTLGRNLYFAKEKSLFVTTDTGTGEPASWPVEMVSNVVGASGVNSIGTGDGWALLIGQNGAFRFDGGEPMPLHKEIQPDWDRINWLYGHLIWCVVDRENERAFIGVPYTAPGDAAATTITKTLVLDYSSGWGDFQRNWSFWSIAGPSCALSRRSSGLVVPVFGGRANDIKAFSLGTWGTTLADDTSVAIPYAYDTALLSLEEVVTRHLFGYATMRISGAGVPVFKAILPDASAVALPQTGLHFGASLPALTAAPLHDLELGINLRFVKLGIRFGPNASTSAYIKVQRLTLWCKEDPAAAIRGGGRKDPTTGTVYW